MRAALGRLAVESLEDRVLLSVSISGHVWHDIDGNGLRESGEPGLAGRTVFADFNNNGATDPGEPTAVTTVDNPSTEGVDESGSYVLSGLTAGNHAIAVAPLVGWNPSLFFPSTAIVTRPEPSYVRAADLDGDGSRDLIVAENLGGSSYGAAVYPNDGEGVFSGSTPYGPGRVGSNMTVGDLDGDGDPDLAVVHYRETSGQIFLNRGDGTFDAASTFGLLDSSGTIEAADLDNDGDLDLTVTHDSYPTQQHVTVVKNDGSGVFGPAVSFAVGQAPAGLSPIDIDQDGDRDLVVNVHGANELTLLLNDGSGSFQPGTPVPTLPSPLGMAAADLNGDGLSDLAITHQGGFVSTFLGDGQGSFHAGATHHVGASLFSIRAVDADGDGDADLAVIAPDDNAVFLLENDGGGGFTSAGSVGVGASPQQLTAADLDGDGRPELAVTNAGSGTISILHNAAGARRVAIADGQEVTDIDFGQRNRAAAPALAGLISRWAGDGDSFDSAGSNHGTLVNGATFAPGLIGQAFRFDGVDDRVEIADSVSLDTHDQLTIETWFRADAVGGSLQALVMHGFDAANGKNNVLSILADGRLNFSVRGVVAGYDDVVGVRVIAPNVWHHAAFTYDGSVGRLYLDGLLEGSTATTIDVDTNSRVLIGHYENPATGGRLTFRGLMDETALYDRALTGEQVAAIFHAGAAGSTTQPATVPGGLVGWWAGQDNAYDNTGHHAGILVDGASFAEGQIGRAFRFDGVDDFVQIPDAPGLDLGQALTLEFWVNQDAFSRRYLVSKIPGSSTGNFGLHTLADGRLRFVTYDTTFRFVDSASGLTPGRWHHVAVTADTVADEVRFFLDGQMESVHAWPHPLPVNDAPLTFGTGEGGISSAGAFNGLLDEISLYDRALTAGEIGEVYGAGVLGKLGPALADITWDGGGGDLNWFNALNWSGNVVPGPADDVAIQAAELVTIAIQGAASVRSLRSDESLFVNGSLTVTAPSSVRGTFDLASYSTLAVAGAGASFRVDGPSIVYRANLRATSGGVIDLPNLSSYSGGGDDHSEWIATGAGSRIQAAGLSSATGPGRHGEWVIEARDGGAIDLSGLGQIGGGAVQIAATGAGSTVDLSGLAQWFKTSDFRLSTLAWHSGGTIDVSALSALKMVSLHAQNGQVMSLPALATYFIEGDRHSDFLATGAGSRLVLPQLTTISGGSRHGEMFVSATGGGAIAMPALSTIVGGTVQIEAVGADAAGNGSAIDVSSLSSWTNNSGFRDSYLRWRGGGTVAVGALRTMNMVSLYATDGQVVRLPALESYTLGGDIHSNLHAIGVGSRLELPLLASVTGSLRHGEVAVSATGGGVISAPSLAQIQGGAVQVEATGAGSAIDFSALINWTNTSGFRESLLRWYGGGTVEVRAVRSIGMVSLYATSGQVVELPALESYTLGGDIHATLSADGAGSRLELPALASVTGSLRHGQLMINATSAGVIAAPALASIAAGAVQVSAVGAGSAIDLSGLVAWSNTSSFRESFLTWYGGATVLAGQLAELSAVSVIAQNGSVVTLPALAIYRGTGDSGSRLRATGAGSRLVLPSLANVSVSVRHGWARVDAETGGTVELPALASVVGGPFSIYATGRDAAGNPGLVQVPSLTSWTGGSISEVRPTGGGVIETGPGTLTASGVAFVVAPDGTIRGGVIELGLGAELRGSGAIEADVLNTAGTVRPGDEYRILAILGDYTQLPGGTMAVQLAGSSPGENHDRLAVTGRADLDGTLAVTRPGGFVPVAGDRFEILGFGSRHCDFSLKTGLDLGGGLYLRAVYAAGTMALVAGVTPDPGRQCEPLPEFVDIRVGPDPAKAGDPLSITFEVAAELQGPPAVTVDGRPATFVSHSGTLFTYSYIVAGTETEGGVSVALSATNTDGQSATAMATLTLDFTAPTISAVTAGPANASRGDALTITFAASEPLSPGTMVSVGGQPASLVGASGLEYTYRRILTGSEGVGTTAVEIVALDRAGNNGSGIGSVELTGGGLAVAAGSIAFSDETPGVGETVQASVVVANTSTVPVLNVPVRFTLREPGGVSRLLAAPTIATIPAGASVTLRVPFDVRSAGLQLFEVHVDPDDVIPEDTEADNTAVRSIVVGDLSGPVILLDVHLSPVAVQPGGELTITGTALYNPAFGDFGPVAGGPVTVAIPGAAGSVTAITGAAGQFSVKIAAPAIPGGHVASVTVGDGTAEEAAVLAFSVLAPVAGVDLFVRPEAITLPGSGGTVVGEPVTVSVEVRNVGADTLTGTVEVHLYEGTTRLGTTAFTSLAAGGFTTVGFAHTFAAAGLHTLRVVVDPADRVAELLETNNIAERTFDVLPAAPDLAPIGVAFSDDTPSVLQSVTVTATVRNSGGATADDVAVRFTDDGIVLDTVTIPHLAAGGVATVSIVATLGSAGTHEIEVVVDPAGHITESSESNNRLAGSIVAHDPAPELAPSEITLSIASPVVGEPVTATVAVRNQGERPSGPFDVQFLRDGLLVETRRIESLAVGASQWLTITTAFDAVGGHDLAVVVDAAAETAELSETNNTATRAVSVVATRLPDLRIVAGEIVMSRTSPAPGESVTVSVPLRNLGDGATSGVEARLAIDGVGEQTINLGSIAAGGFATASFTFVAPMAEGYHLLEIVADPGNALGEVDENNNRGFRLFLIGQTPDLVVSAVAISSGAPTEGEVLSITATIGNIGAGAAAGVGVSFYDGVDLIGHLAGMELTSGSTVDVSVPYATDSRAGVRTIRVVVDPADAIPESDEANNEASAALTVAPRGNTPPVVLAPITDLAVAEDASPVILDLAATFDDGDIATRGDRLTFSVPANSNPALVATTLTEAGLTLALAPDAHGSALITVRATDTTGAYVDDTFLVSVAPVNDAPESADDSFVTTEDATLVIAAPGVLANDRDPDGEPIAAHLLTGPAHGTLTLNPDGSFTYSPEADFHGTDGFTYEARDGALTSRTATVRITVGAVNDAPTAVDDTFAIAEDTTLIVGVPGVLANDEDADGDVLTAILISPVSSGTLTLDTEGSIRYTPSPDAHGPAWFTYAISDGSAMSHSATVTITVSPVNDAPVAQGDSFSTIEDTPLVVTLPGLLGNDSDIDGDSLTAVLVSGPSHGELVLQADGTCLYTPHADFHGTDGFTYVARDGSAESGPATVSITVEAVNDDPVTVDDEYTTQEDAPLVVAGPGVLANDRDVEGDVLSASLISGPDHGTLTLNPDGSFTYTPDVDFNGTDRFHYAAGDGTSGGIEATVTIRVLAVNDAPVAADDAFATSEDVPLSVVARGVLENDGDIEGDDLSALLASAPSHGGLTLNADGSFTYTPDRDFHGLDSFSYRAFDGMLNSAVATVTITVGAVNDAPVAVAGPDLVAAEGRPVVLDGRGSFDPDGDGLIYHWDFGDGTILSAGPANPSHVYADDGTYTVTLTVSDGVESRADALLVTVQNVGPVLDPLALTAEVDEGGAATLTGSFHDPGTGDRHTLTVAWGDGRSETLTLAPGARTFSLVHTYTDDTPSGTSADPFAVRVTLSDDDGGEDTAGAATVVRNVEPTAGPIQGPALAIRGQDLVFASSVGDVGLLDTHEVAWDFGDGTVRPFQPASDPSALTPSHAFAASGTYTVTMTVRDDDGGLSSASAQVVVSAAAVVPDPCGGWMLAVGGTASDDLISISRLDGQGFLVVIASFTPGGIELTVGTFRANACGFDWSITVNGLSVGVFSTALTEPIGRIAVYSQDGDDDLQVGGSVDLPARLDGGAGDDRIKGGGGHDILLGGAGDDLIIGGGGRDLIVGGTGSDRLIGNADDDILIAGTTAYDAHDAALCAILAEWTSSRSYADRVANLRGDGSEAGRFGARRNGGYFLAVDGTHGHAATVFSDEAIDLLTGSAGLDWFLFNRTADSEDSTRDRETDLSAAEFADDLDFINGE